MKTVARFAKSRYIFRTGQRTMPAIKIEELKELLNKSWMTHDGMWFRHCLEVCGIEQTNRINKAAIYSAARVEAKRLAKALGFTTIETFEQLERFIEQATAVIQADFMKFTCAAPQKNVLRWEMQQCFAHEGVTRLGVIDQYQCGIFERIKGWLDSLGIEYTITPDVTGCMMHREGHCYREFHFRFD
jgi:hypothetical protein